MENSGHEIKPEVVVRLSPGWRFLIVFQFVALIVVVAALAWQMSHGTTVIRERVAGAVAPASLSIEKNGIGGDKNTVFDGHQSYQAPGDVYWIAELADKSLPFVVNVRSETVPDKKTESQGQDNPNGMYRQFQIPDNGNSDIPDELKKMMPFFQMPGDSNNYHDFNYDVPRMGEGSGFIVSDKGYVVTNAHVVADFDKFTVTLNGGKQYEGKLVGRDDLKDIAVIKIEAANLPSATLGDSAALRPGEPAIAIGSPFGLQHTVTAGIISATDRKPQDIGAPDDPRSNQNLIQTDAAINQGNSGGPLLNARGEIIGINEAIIPVGERIGFAIPVNSVKHSIEEIIQHGSVRYPGIGVQITSVEEWSSQTGEKLKDVSEGVIIRTVTQGSPGDKAGLKAGDVITEMDGKKVNSSNELINLIQDHGIGDRITLIVYPQGRKPAKQVLVVLGELNSDDAAPWKNNR